MRNIFLALAFLSLTVLVSFKAGKSVGLKAAGSVNSSDVLDLSLMWKVKDKLTQSFLEKDKINDEEMTYGAISGMVEALNDPYTVFLSPKDNKSSNDDLAGEF